MNYIIFIIMTVLLSIVVYLNYDLKITNPLITAFTSLIMVIVGVFSKHFYDIWKKHQDKKKNKKDIATLLTQELDLCKFEWNENYFYKDTDIHGTTNQSAFVISYSKLAILETYLQDIKIFDDNLIYNLTKFYNLYHSYINIRLKYIYVLEKYLSIPSADMTYGPNIDNHFQTTTHLNMLCDIAINNIKQLQSLHTLILKDLKKYTKNPS